MNKICLKNKNYSRVIAYLCKGQVGLLIHGRYSNPVSCIFSQTFGCALLEGNTWKQN